MNNDNFISIHDALPAINCLVEYKYSSGNVGTTRIGMDIEQPILLWLGLNGDSLKSPKYLTHWRYVIDDEVERKKEAEEWLRSLSNSQPEHSDNIKPFEVSL